MTYCWYLNRLPQENRIRAKWLNFDRWGGDKRWPWNETIFEDQVKENLYDSSSCKEALETSDIAIYQPNFQNKGILQNLKIGPKEISISPIFTDDLAYVKRKESKYGTTIIVSDLIEKYPENLLKKGQPNHISVFFNLEVIKRICWVCGFKYFSSETLDYLKSYQYPKF